MGLVPNMSRLAQNVSRWAVDSSTLDGWRADRKLRVPFLQTSLH